MRSISSTVRLSSAELRREVSGRSLRLAEGRPHEATLSAIPSVLFQEADGVHGNFLAASYRRICASPDWSRRLKKCYTASNQLARSSDRIRRELDCANSSDALLMNIFCYPGVTSRGAVCALLGVERGLRPRFGVKPGSPLVSGRADRTEIDMALGHLLVEAKLTEGGFQNARSDLVLQYQGLCEVFEVGDLPVSAGRFHSYQLVRGIMAARHRERSFLVLCDGRRLDLIEAWYRVLRAVRSCELRSKMALLTWQELSRVLPVRLQRFLERKYGIC